MKRIVVDTNVLVSFLTDRDARQQARAARLFDAAAAGEVQIILHQLVVTELIYVLRTVYAVDAAEVAATLHDLLALPGVVPVDELPWPAVLALWPRRIEGFVDAALVAVTRAGKHDALATFDDRLRRRVSRLGVSTAW
jgi:predicted nucleic acid-binding protein